MNLNYVKTDSSNNDFLKLVSLLDTDLSKRYGNKQKQYKKYNKVDYIKVVVLVYNKDTPVACGAIKEYNNSSAELKRVYVVNQYRKQGIAKKIISELEKMAKIQGFKYLILETGIKQFEAISLYNSLGYKKIENYGPYIGNENSICMKKQL